MNDVHDHKTLRKRWSASQGEKLRLLVGLTTLSLVTMVMSVATSFYVYSVYDDLNRSLIRHEKIIESLQATVRRMEDGQHIVDHGRKPSQIVHTDIEKDGSDTEHRVKREIQTKPLSRKNGSRKKSRRQRKGRRRRRHRGLYTCKWCKKLDTDMKSLRSMNSWMNSTMKTVMFSERHKLSLPAIHLRGIKPKSAYEYVQGPDQAFSWSLPDTNNYAKYFVYETSTCFLKIKVSGLYLVYSQVTLAGRKDPLEMSIAKEIPYTAYNTVRVPDARVSTTTDRLGVIMSSAVTQHRRGLAYAGRTPIDTLSHMGVFWVNKGEKLYVKTDGKTHGDDRFLNSDHFNHFGAIKID